MPRAPLDPSIVPSLTLFAIGFGIGVIGHIVKSKTLIASGLAVVYVAIVFLPIYNYLAR